MKIIIDQRERNSLVIEELKELGVQCDVRHLTLADYIISKDIAIERKTVSDFVGSMINKRLVNQLTDLKANYKKPLLLVEGLDEDDLYSPSTHPNINENAIRGMLLSIAVDLEIPIIFTRNYQDTAKYLLLLIKRQGRSPREYSLSVTRKAFSLKEHQQIVIESFPGVGPNLAKNLLKHFRTINALMNADVKELVKIPKVGKKKAASIKKIVDSKYR